MPVILSGETGSPAALLSPLLTRQQSLGFSSNPFPERGLHPAAIFGITAAILITVAVFGWCIIFRTWKKVMTNRQHGLPPTLRVAATGAPRTYQYGAQAGPPPPPYTGYGPPAVGLDTPYPPMAHHDNHATNPYSSNLKPLPLASFGDRERQDTAHDAGSSGRRYDGRGGPGV